jgi:hypothetical protein
MRLGVYRYTETPPGNEADQESEWLEVYRQNLQEPLLELKFDAKKLTPEDLNTAREKLVSEWREKMRLNQAPQSDGVGALLG